MKPQNPILTLRQATPEDVDELCGLLNAIIEIGGTTAFETALTPDQFRDCYLEGDQHLSCTLAVDTGGGLAGFQALERRSDLPDGWADIATFARMSPKIPGVGTTLFNVSRQFARQSGIIAINATIRADNAGGLIFYDRLGFRTYAVTRGVPLQCGTPMDRISKQFPIR